MSVLTGLLSTKTNRGANFVSRSNSETSLLPVVRVVYLELTFWLFTFVLMKYMYFCTA